MPCRLLAITTISATLEAFLLPFGEYFRRLGWRVEAVANGAYRSDKCRQAFDNVWEVSWTRHPLDARNFAGPVRQIQHLVRERRYDIVHVHTPVAGFVTRYALRRLRLQSGGPKVIYTAHGFHFQRHERGLRPSVFLWLEQLAGHWTDYLVVINREDEVVAKHHRIVPEDRVVYMPGIGVDTRQYCPEAVSAEAVKGVRQELGLCEQDRLFLMVAEFNPGKRHRDAIEALATLSDQRVHLAFAGDGPLLQAIKGMVQRLGLSHRVHFLGWRDDVPVLIRASVATLLPSEREGLPRSVMESLSLGVPVIGADTRGIRDLLDERVGLLVPVGCPTELAKAMAWAINHPTEARKMGDEGRRKMTAYDINRIIAMHEELYDRALGDLDENRAFRFSRGRPTK